MRRDWDDKGNADSLQKAIILAFQAEARELKEEIEGFVRARKQARKQEILAQPVIEDFSKNDLFEEAVRPEEVKRVQQLMTYLGDEHLDVVGARLVARKLSLPGDAEGALDIPSLCRTDLCVLLLELEEQLFVAAR